MTEYLKGLNGHFSVVVLSTKTQDVSHIERYHGSRLLRVPVGGGDLASRLQTFERAIRRQLESEEYALVHFTDPFGGYVLSELKSRYGYRIIYEADSFPSQDLRYIHPSLAGDRKLLAKVRRQELFCLMNADLVLTGSQVTRTFIQGLGVNAERIQVQRAPVDLGPYARVREPDGIPMRVLYLGSQLAWQGLPTLLRAVQRASVQVDLRLTLAGPSHPDYQPRLDDLLKELQLRDKVDQLAPVPHDELPKLLSAADLGVLPLEDNDRIRGQGAPLAKVSEYFAAGRPVVAADLPVCRELLPESAATFFNPGDVDELATRLVELARAPRRRVEMGTKARAEAVRHLDSVRLRERLLQCYEELLGGAEKVVAPKEEDEPPETTSLTGTPTGRISERLDSGPTPVAFQRQVLGDDVPTTDPRGRDIPDTVEPEITDPGGRLGPTVPWADTDPRRQLIEERLRADPHASGDTDPHARHPTLELTREAVDEMLGNQGSRARKEANEKRTSRRRKKEKAAKARAEASQLPSMPPLDEAGPPPTEQATTRPPLSTRTGLAAEADERPTESREGSELPRNSSASPESSRASFSESSFSESSFSESSFSQSSFSQSSFSESLSKTVTLTPPWAEPVSPPTQEMSSAAHLEAQTPLRAKQEEDLPATESPPPLPLANPTLPEPPRSALGLPSAATAPLGFGPETRTDFDAPSLSTSVQRGPSAGAAASSPAAPGSGFEPGTVGVPASKVPRFPSSLAEVEKATASNLSGEPPKADIHSAPELPAAPPAAPVPALATAAPPPLPLPPPLPSSLPLPSSQSSAALMESLSTTRPAPSPGLFVESAGSGAAASTARPKSSTSIPAASTEPAASTGAAVGEAPTRSKPAGSNPPPVLFPAPPPNSLALPDTASEAGARVKSGAGVPSVTLPAPMPTSNPLPPLAPTARTRSQTSLAPPVLYPQATDKPAPARAATANVAPGLLPEVPPKLPTSAGPSESLTDPSRLRAPLPPGLPGDNAPKPGVDLPPRARTISSQTLLIPEGVAKPPALPGAVASEAASRAKPQSPTLPPIVHLEPPSRVKAPPAPPPILYPEPFSRPAPDEASRSKPPVLPFEPASRGGAPAALSPTPPALPAAADSRPFSRPVPVDEPEEVFEELVEEVADISVEPALDPGALGFPTMPPEAATRGAGKVPGDATAAGNLTEQIAGDALPQRPFGSPTSPSSATTQGQRLETGHDLASEAAGSLPSEAARSLPPHAAGVLSPDAARSLPSDGIEELSSEDAEELPPDDAGASSSSDALSPSAQGASPPSFNPALEALADSPQTLAQSPREKLPTDENVENLSEDTAEELAPEEAEELPADATEELPPEEALELTEEAAALVETGEILALPFERPLDAPVPEKPDTSDAPGPELPPSQLNPWFAQLAHGYCPPAGVQFARHTPPTTFPGRDTPVAPAPRPKSGELPAAVPPQNSKT